MFGFDSFNETTIIGRLGNDIEVKYTQSGTAIASFSVAVKKYNPSTKKSDLVEWFRCSSFDETICKQGPNFAKKGDLVLVKGEMSSREYEKDSVKHTVWELKAFGFVKLGDGKKAGTSERPAAAAASAPVSAPEQSSIVEDDDGIPF